MARLGELDGGVLAQLAGRAAAAREPEAPAVDLEPTTLARMLEDAVKDNDTEAMGRILGWGGRASQTMLIMAVSVNADRAMARLLELGLDPSHIGSEKTSAFSLWARLGGIDHKDAQAYRRCGRLMLDAGANPRLGWMGRDGGRLAATAWAKENRQRQRPATHEVLQAWRAEIERRSLEASTAVATGISQGRRL